MAELNLLETYPKAKRNLNERAATAPEDRAIAKQFGKEYFDGTRNQGYGGYKYDGRWRPVVKRMQQAYGLTSESRVLDVGSGKGFMLHDFMLEIPGITVAGIEISPYGVEQTMDDVKPFVQIGNAINLPFADKSFDLVTAINVVHNLKGDELKQSLREMERVSRKHKFLVVDAYCNDEEYQKLMKWNLTAETILHASEWEALFKEVGYTGDYFWFAP